MKFLKYIFTLSIILIFSTQSFAASATDVINNFAFNAAKLISSEAGNSSYFFSPYSVITAFSMAYAGAKEDTAREIEDVLGFDFKIHSELGKLSQELESTNSLSAANRVWVKDDLKLKRAYTKLLKSKYNSTVEQLDFRNKTETSRKIINDWVSSKTNDRIKNLLQKLEPETLMILTNAVYFNGEWSKKFNKRRTADEKFYIDELNVKDVPMMKQRGDFSYAEQDGYKIIRLPYNDGRFSMLAVLPVAKFQNDFENINYETVKKLISSMSRYEVDLWLPKFKTEDSYELRELFANLGIKSAFSDFADFSGMTASKSDKLKISNIIHKSFIELDEEKTEAAAATAITMVRATALPNMNKNRAEFHADHPFIYMIVDDNTNAILFIGKQNFSD